METLRFAPASDRSLLVSLGEGISLAVHRRVAALTRSFQADPVPEVLNIHPAYSSILVIFDALKTDHTAIERAVRERAERVEGAPARELRTVQFPVCYGGEFGPDLNDLAAHAGLTPERVVALHASACYTVYFIGFVPGFAYLGGLPSGIAAPRLTVPRNKVPRGSVGIAGSQTGMYPFETPGGWRLIGRTPVLVFDAARDPMSLIEIGDRVRFVPITPDEYQDRSR